MAAICVVQEKPFRCPLCERCFGQQTNLDRHLKKHESDGPNVLDSPPPDLDCEMTSPPGPPQSPAPRERDAYFSEIRQFIGQACGGPRGYGPPGAGAPLLPPAAASKWFLGRYGDARARSPVDLDDEDPDWEDREAAAAGPRGSAALNGSWSGHRRLMAALGGVATGGGPAAGGRAMLHGLLAMTSGAGERASYPPVAASPPVKSPTRPGGGGGALKPTSNVAPPCVF